MNFLRSMKLLLQLTFLLILLPLSNTLLAKESLETPDGASKKQVIFDRLISDFGKIRTGVDNTQFDQEALIDRLDYEAETIIEFVTKEITLQIYPGLLRGAKGTLISRAGNSLDQAVLLASLLNTAGYDARIARTTLNIKLSEMLVAHSAAVRVRPDTVDEDSNLQVSKKLCVDLNVDCSEIFSRVAQTSKSNDSLENLKRKLQTEKNYLLSKLDHAGIDLASNDSSDLLKKEASDYFWVQYRSSAAGPWVDINTTLPDQEDSFRDLKPEETFGGQVPSALTHRISISTVIEQVSGEQTITKAISGPWERPVANLTGDALTFSILSTNLMSRPDGTPIGAQDIRSDIFMPSFSGGGDGLAFDIYGNTYPADVALSNYAGIFKTFGNKVRDALGALDDVSAVQASLDRKESLQRLKKVKLIYKYNAPGYKEQTFERLVFDGASLFENYKKEKEFLDPYLSDAYRDLTKIYTIYTETGSPSPAYFLDNQMRLLTQKLRLWKLGEDRSQGVSQNASEILDVDSADRLSWMPISFLPVMFDKVLASDISSYRHKATILAHHRSLSIGGDIEHAVDIIQNDRRVVAVQDGSVKLSSNKVLELGVWDTLVEQELLSQLYGEAIGTHTTMQAARSKNQSVFVLTGVNDPDLKKFPSNMKQLLTEDLNNGFVVVAPIANVGEQDLASHWWRINPTTGHVLGMNSRGEGGAEITKRVVLTTIAFHALAAIILCHNGTSSDLNCLGYAPLAGGVFLTYYGGAGYYTFAVAVAALKALFPEG